MQDDDPLIRLYHIDQRLRLNALDYTIKKTTSCVFMWNTKRPMRLKLILVKYIADGSN